MKIAFVVDTDNSALFTSAYQWCKMLNGEIYTAANFKSFKDLLNKLINQQPDLIIFSWRQVLDVVFLSKRNLELLNRLKFNSCLLALVADHSADQPDRLQKDFRLSEANIGLVTVTERLLKFYSDFGLVPVGILPDRPDCDLIREVRSESHIPLANSVIWIGNSQWGKRHGYRDHKGLHSKFEPFLNLAKAKGISLEGIVIDSAVNKFPQREVIRNLAKSELLIVTSASEGTCLPILEALGVGTNVISTDVGIANLFTTVQLLPNNTSPRDILESFVKWKQAKVSAHEVVSDFEHYINRLDEHWDRLIFEVERIKATSVSIGKLEGGRISRTFKLVFWNLKFLLNWVRLQNVKQNK